MTVTFANLKTRIAAKLTDGDLQYPTSSQIGDIINDIIFKYENKQFWWLFSSATITLNPSDPVVPNIPSDFKNEINPGGLVIVYNSIRYVLEKIKPDVYDMRNISAVGLPSTYTFRNGQYLLLYYPQLAYTLTLNYRILLTALSADGDNNVFTNNAYRLIEYAALEDIYATYKKDPEMASYYKTKVKEEFTEIMDETYQRMASGKLTPEMATYYTDYNWR